MKNRSARNTSPAFLSREFLLPYHITGRVTIKYPTNIFTRVNSSFEQNNSVLRKKSVQNVRPSKKSPEKTEEVRATVSENWLRSLRKSKPLFNISQTTLYRILKDDLK